MRIAIYYLTSCFAVSLASCTKEENSKEASANIISSCLIEYTQENPSKTKCLSFTNITPDQNRFSEAGCRKNIDDTVESSNFISNSSNIEYTWSSDKGCTNDSAIGVCNISFYAGYEVFYYSPGYNADVEKSICNTSKGIWTQLLEGHCMTTSQSNSNLARCNSYVGYSEKQLATVQKECEADSNTDLTNTWVANTTCPQSLFIGYCILQRKITFEKQYCEEENQVSDPQSNCSQLGGTWQSLPTQENNAHSNENNSCQTGDNIGYCILTKKMEYRKYYSSYEDTAENSESNCNQLNGTWTSL